MYKKIIAFASLLFQQVKDIKNRLIIKYKSGVSNILKGIKLSWHNKRFFTFTKAKIKSLRLNVKKIILIFSVSFIFKYLINKHLGINVFTEYSNWISIIFYLGFATFIVFINELFYKMPNFAWISKIRKKLSKWWW